MTDTKVNDHRQVKHRWESPEFHRIPRGKWWYISVGAAFAICLLYGLISRSFSMLLAFIALGATFFLVGSREPKVYTTELTDMGISFKNKFYPFHQINAFWIVYQPPFVDVLYLKIRQDKKLEILKIELNQEDPKPIRNFLIKEIPEIEGAGEPMIDVLSRLFKIH